MAAMRAENNGGPLTEAAHLNCQQHGNDAVRAAHARQPQKPRHVIVGIPGKDKLRSGYVRLPTIRGVSGPGRNDKCPCGSGKKFKKCCGKPKQPHQPPRRKSFLVKSSGGTADAMMVPNSGTVTPLGNPLPVMATNQPSD